MFPKAPKIEQATNTPPESTDAELAAVAEKSTQALLASSRGTADELDKAHANIFNDAFNAPAPNDQPIGDGITLTMGGGPDPNEDLIQWCRENKDTYAGSGHQNVHAPTPVTMIDRLINAYLLLVATDLNEESLENAVVEIETHDEDELRAGLTGEIADVTISCVEGYFHVQARTRGSDQQRAKWMAERVLWFLAENRKAFVRAMPEAATDKNYDTGAEIHHGYVRFSFKDEPGKWEKAARAG